MEMREDSCVAWRVSASVVAALAKSDVNLRTSEYIYLFMHG